MPDATIYDVAKRAGVSITTVSRVLNAPDRVNISTRSRVLDVIDELNFVPLVLAKEHAASVYLRHLSRILHLCNACAGLPPWPIRPTS
jgi:LacI family transcriptional regulator